MSNAQQALRQALIELLQEQDFHQLQVKAISTRAGVARATFYLHYPSKEALLLDYVDTIFEGFLTRIEDALADISRLDQQAALRMFQVLASEKTLCRAMSQDSLQALLMARFRGYISRIAGHLLQQQSSPHSIEQLNYAIDFWAGGSFLLIRRWIEQDFSPDETTMAQLYSQLTLTAFRQLVG